MPTTITMATIIALPKSNNNHKASFSSATNFLILSFNEIAGCLSDPILHELAWKESAPKEDKRWKFVAIYKYTHSYFSTKFFFPNSDVGN